MRTARGRPSWYAALPRVVQEHARDDTYEIAGAYAHRGEPDQVFAWLEGAYRQKDAGLYEIKGIKDDPLLKNFAADPRYAAFLRMVNLLD